MPEENSRNREQGNSKVYVMVESLLWFGAAFIVSTYFNFLYHVLHDERKYMSWLLVGLALSVVILGQFVYLVFYLPYWLGLRKVKDWDRYCPRVIPIMTALAVAATVCFNVALWPVWGILTPVILFVVFMGYVIPLYVD